MINTDGIKNEPGQHRVKKGQDINIAILKAVATISLTLFLSAIMPGFAHAEVLQVPLCPDASFYVHPWTVDDGTPLNTVMGVVRRADGYLWVATRFGLFRFDGENFESVSQLSEAALPGVVTPVLCEDRRGRLWLTKIKSNVVCVDDGEIRVFTPRDGLPQQTPLSIAEDKEGAVWISYYNPTAPLCRIKDGLVQTFDFAPGGTDKSPTLLAGDSHGQLWFARGRQVGVLRDQHLVPLQTLERPVTCITAVRSGGLWVSDGRQVFKYRDGEPLKSLGSVSSSGIVNCLYEDRRGRLWVASSSSQ